LETRPQIVCLCGSTRFAQEIRAVNRDLTLAGTIVVAPAVFEHAREQITEEQKAALGALHFAKIDLADRVMVVNPGGYIGESTRREIHYAQQTGKPVEYTDAPDSFINP
jgi:dienelactone hydrolase